LSRGKQRITHADVRNYLTQHSIMFGEEELRYYFHQNNFGPEITLNE
jgi:hypothetical protein